MKYFNQKIKININYKNKNNNNNYFSKKIINKNLTK